MSAAKQASGHTDLLDHEDPEFIAALEHYLQRHGWSRSELSRRTKINTSTISDWMRGHYGPGSEALRAICEAFGISRSKFWSQGEWIVEERRREDEERRKAEEVARFEGLQSADQIAAALLEVEPEVRDEVMRIVLQEIGKKVAAGET